MGARSGAVQTHEVVLRELLNIYTRVCLDKAGEGC